jgi:transposase
MRVIGLVEEGASRREAAERLEVSVSSAVRWMQRWCEDRISGPKPRGGSTSPLERHAEWILALVAEQPDLTLDEIVSAMHKKRIRGSRTALWRFFARHNITVKKKPTRSGTAASRRSSRASTLGS